MNKRYMFKMYWGLNSNNQQELKFSPKHDDIARQSGKCHCRFTDSFHSERKIIYTIFIVLFYHIFPFMVY